MIAEILATGEEIRSGAVIDSNSAYIASKLEEAGIQVVRHHCVGDNAVLIAEVINEISRRSDTAVVTGGLGPTTDDVTAEGAAKAAGVKLKTDPKALEMMQGFFDRLKVVMSRSNKKQALLPEGSEPIYNPLGTAPGFVSVIRGCTFFFLPGVPGEMKRMLEDRVIPRLKKSRPQDRSVLITKTMSAFGLPESKVGERLAGLEDELKPIKIGLRAVAPEIQVKLYAGGEDEKALTDRLNRAVERIREQLGDHIFSLDGSPMEAVVGRMLAEQKKTVAFAESCTGGLMADMITRTAGSSAYFLFSAVTYSNSSKIDVAAVSPSTIDRFGAVHEETAKEMALGVKNLTQATYGLSVSGIAGPGGGTQDKPVGTLCVGLAAPDGVYGYRFYFPTGTREVKKKRFAFQALNLLRLHLMGNG